MTDTRTCTACGRDLPATAEYFYRQPGGKGGLHSQCKTCRRDHINSARRAARPEPAPALQTQRWLLVDEARGVMQRCTLTVDDERPLARSHNDALLVSGLRAMGYRIVRISKGEVPA